MILFFNKFPHYTQLEYSDCGHTCLKILIKYYGKDCDIEFIQNLCITTKQGITMQDISIAAESIGFKSYTIIANVEVFLSSLVLPCILYWQKEHFVVLYKVKKNIFYISDPAFGLIKIQKEEFIKLWTIDDKNEGVALTLKPTESFYKKSFPVKSQKEKISSFLVFVRDLFRFNIMSFLYLLIIISLMALIGYIFPKTIISIFDNAINLKSYNTLWKILYFQLSLMFGQFFFSWVSAKIRINVGMKISVKLITDLLFKVIRLPIKFFDNRIPADIFQRIEDQSHIEKFMTEDITQTLFSFILIIILSAQLINNQVFIGISYLILSIISIIWGILFLKKRGYLEYANFRLQVANKNSLNEIIHGMNELKINNAQQKRVNTWIIIQNKLHEIRKKSLRLKFLQAIVVQILIQIKRIGINIACAYLVIQNKMSVGEMLGIGYIVGTLESPLEEVIKFAHDSLFNIILVFKRLNAIQNYEDENKNNKIFINFNICTGLILKNISFKYDGSSNPYVLKNINLEIPKGKITAIVGSSGSGKTTLLKLLLSFYYPQMGDIFLDNIKLNHLNTDNWRDKCGVVMQDGYIFSESIASNIALSDEILNIEKLNFAIKTACIYDFIKSLPMESNTKIGNTGIELSGGQKQRLLIARAVYKNPEFIFFDEATSSLDANNEKQIMENLNVFFRGKTVIVIAHRLSTVKNADQIIVLEKGEVVEVGNHQNLTKKRGKYYELVKNQLELGG